MSRAATAKPAYVLLPWDSDVFGFTVAAVDAGRCSDERGLATTLAAMRAASVRLAYLSLPDGSPAELVHVAGRLGGRPVGERVTFVAPLERIPPPPRPPDSAAAVERHVGPTTHELVRLARQAGSHSRFSIDPDVGERTFRKIYDAWIERSVSGEIADAVFVVRDARSVIALVTVAQAGDRSKIGLLAVDEVARGRGVGAALVRHAQEWGHARGAGTAEVVTQASNASACALYRRCGYEVETTQPVFHFWL
jgi:dTDP-4-amino-4,6-dideoxy-D-galactose acyltransferase